MINGQYIYYMENDIGFKKTYFNPSMNTEKIMS